MSKLPDFEPRVTYVVVQDQDDWGYHVVSVEADHWHNVYASYIKGPFSNHDEAQRYIDGKTQTD